MVRRRKPAGGFSSNKTRSGPKPSGSSKSNSYKKSRETVPENDEDLFFEGRDKILLDGTDSLSRGRELADLDDEEEVFALKGMDDDSDEDGGEYDEGDAMSDGDDDSDEDEDDDLPTPPAKSSKKTPAPKSKSGPAPASDDSDSEEEEERWGKSKSAYYSSNAPDLDSDDEEARLLEEQEAIRLQAKARDGLGEDDFGILSLASTSSASKTPKSATNQSLAVSAPTVPKDKASVLRELERTNPEVLALAREWEDVAVQLRQVGEAVDSRTRLTPDHPSLGMIHLHHQTLLTYASVLAHYLHVRTTPTPGPTPNASTTSKNVPDIVIERLYALKHALSVLEDIGFSAIEKEDDDPVGMGMNGLVVDGEEDGSEEEEELDSEDLDSEDDDGDSEEGSVDLDALEAKYSDARIDEIMGELESGRTIRFTSEPSFSSLPSSTPSAKGKKNGTKDTPLVITLPAKKSADKEKKNKKKAKNSASTSSTPTPVPAHDLVQPAFGTYAKSLGLPSSSSSTPSTSTAAPSFYAFGEASSLSLAETDAKAAKKKSLKFHTSKIESASRRREAARQRAMGGDDDLPVRDERGARRERERKAAEAARAGKAGLGGDDLDDAPVDGGDAMTNGNGDAKGKKRAREDDYDGDEGDVGAEGYYDLVKKSKKQAKLDKKAAYDAEVAASKPDFSEDVTGAGPRSLTRAILKNKGLTPHRAKSVRNPRVKKKLRFEQAKKRVSSKRAVFKGGMASLPGGRYEGEKSGISKVIKSVKL